MQPTAIDRRKTVSFDAAASESAVTVRVQKPRVILSPTAQDDDSRVWKVSVRYGEDSQELSSPSRSELTALAAQIRGM